MDKINTKDIIVEQTIYLCVEKLITTDGTKYEVNDRIAEEAYASLQPREREHFEDI